MSKQALPTTPNSNRKRATFLQIQIPSEFVVIQHLDLCGSLIQLIDCQLTGTEKNSSLLV